MRSTRPALDRDGFRTRQRAVLDSITAAYVLAMLGWLLPGIVLLAGIGITAGSGGPDAASVLALTPWISVVLYGRFSFDAALVPLRRRPDARRPAGGQYLAERGGHAMVCAVGFGYTVLWTAVVVLFAGFGGAWAILGWSAIGTLGLLTTLSALRSLGGLLGFVPAAWQTHPDDAVAALTDDARSRPD